MSFLSSLSSDKSVFPFFLKNRLHCEQRTFTFHWKSLLFLGDISLLFLSPCHFYCWGIIIICVFYRYSCTLLSPSTDFISIVRCESAPRATGQPGCLKLLTSHVLQTSRCNQSMAGWQIVPSMYSDKQISAKMLLVAYQMCWALVRNRRWKSVHVPSVLQRDHRCSNFCWTKWCKHPGWSRVTQSEAENAERDPVYWVGGSPPKLRHNSTIMVTCHHLLLQNLWFAHLYSAIISVWNYN